MSIKMYPEAQQILVIDCDSERRRRHVRLLSDEGFAVTAVGEGFSAIRAVARHRFSLVIAAVELPGALDGRETVRQLRARQASLKALYTGDPAQRPCWPTAGGDDFIAAPSQRRDLLGCVFEMLQRHGGQAGRNDRSRAL